MLRVQVREALDTGQPLAVSELESVRARFSGLDGYADALILLASDATDAVSTGATWLLKNDLEAGHSLSPAQVGRLVHGLAAVTVRNAQLHVCQSIRFLRLPSGCAAPLLDWLRPLRTSQHPFLRAWSIDATCETAIQHPNAMPEARAVLKAATEDPSASVRARARAIARRFEG